jgi:CRP/FNR family transcriptional regulator
MDLHDVTHIAKPAADSCSQCFSRLRCAPAVGAAHMQDNRLVARRIRVPRGTALFNRGEPAGDRFYVVHFGSFKTSRSEDGDGQRIAALHLNADCVGLDAIGQSQHRSTAVALEDSEVCEILCSSMRLQLPTWHKILSRELQREQQMGQLLRDSSADQRLAMFLLDMSERYAARGYSASNFLLRITRQDIADYLSLTRESISRGLVRFQRAGLIGIEGRELHLRDAEALHRVATGPRAAPLAA